MYVLKKTTKHTHARAHTRTHARISDTSIHVKLLVSCIVVLKSSIRQNVYRESNIHILSGYRYWSMNQKALRTFNIHT